MSIFADQHSRTPTAYYWSILLATGYLLYVQARIAAHNYLYAVMKDELAALGIQGILFIEQDARVTPVYDSLQVSPTHHSLLTTRHLLLTTCYSLSRYLLLAACYLLLTTLYSLLATRCLLLATHYSLLATRYLSPTTWYLPTAI